jgi:hypothetical protein
VLDHTGFGLCPVEELGISAVEYLGSCVRFSLYYFHNSMRNQTLTSKKTIFTVRGMEGHCFVVLSTGAVTSLLLLTKLRH